MPFAEHLVATIRGPKTRSLLDFETAHWLWTRTRSALPDLLSCVLMPDHTHMTAPPGRAPRLRQLLNRASAQFGIRFDLHVEPIHTRAILGRVVRYNLLNPVRAELVLDPYEWPWSTLRDLAGACDPIWTPGSRVATALRRRGKVLLPYLTNGADNECPPLAKFEPTVATELGVRRAVAAALRCPVERACDTPLGRKLIVQVLARLDRHIPSGITAESVGLSPGSVRRLRQAPRDEAALQAVLQCLADPRLCPPVAPPKASRPPLRARLFQTRVSRDRSP